VAQISRNSLREAIMMNSEVKRLEEEVLECAEAHASEPIEQQILRHC
jgi:hypothetical protein